MDHHSGQSMVGQCISLSGVVSLKPQEAVLLVLEGLGVGVHLTSEPAAYFKTAGGQEYKKSEDGGVLF